MNKIRGKIPSLISAGNGYPEKDMPQKKCFCSRCEAVIMEMSTSFLIPKKVNGFTNKKRYCLGCFKDVIDQTKKDLDEITKLVE